MSRSVEQRTADVRRLLRASQGVFERRAEFSSAIAAATGLTPEGVELGFESLERDASDDEVRSLVAAAGQAQDVHVILAANVFVAPLRALALARAASGRVTVRPSPRDPILTRAIVDAARDDALAVVDERDVAIFDGAEIHVYGRDETTEAVRRRARPHTVVRDHGAGMGVAFVSASAEVEVAAAELARDVVPFDQRGCLSPRIAFVEGEAARGVSFAAALDRQLDHWQRHVPRGRLARSEVAEFASWRDALAFAGRLWCGSAHAVGLAPSGAPLTLPPPGRHVHVVPVASSADLAAYLAPMARFVVAVGTDDPAALGRAAPSHARVSALGRMQRPAFDGPVDKRASEAGGQAARSVRGLPCSG